MYMCVYKRETETDICEIYIEMSISMHVYLCLLNAHLFINYLLNANTR